MSWYEDLADREHDDAYLQDIYHRLQTDLPPDAQLRTADVHLYPSRRCTYTIAKQRVFVRVRDAKGEPIPECVLRHVILHELGPRKSQQLPTIKQFLNHYFFHPFSYFLCPFIGFSRPSHVINPTSGHDQGFHKFFAWLRSWVTRTCEDRVPQDFNPCD